MINKLKLLSERLSVFVETIEVKGEGKSEFLYVTGNGKSVEISLDDGHFWVEYWEDLDEDAKPVCENTFGSMDVVENNIREWFGYD